MGCVGIGLETELVNYWLFLDGFLSNFRCCAYTPNSGVQTSLVGPPYNITSETWPETNGFP